MKVKFLENVVHYDHENKPIYGYQEGEVADLRDDVANRWVRRNKATPHDGAEEAETIIPLLPATLEEVIDAIGKLDKADEKVWTKNGLPQVSALEAILGNRKITAEQRDLAAIKYQSKE